MDTTFDALAEAGFAEVPDAVQARVCADAGLGRDEPLSLALVDWPAVDHFCRLLEHPRDVGDPFVALWDFSVVIGALIFYDRLLVLDDAGIGDRALRALGEPAIRAINPSEQSTPFESDSSLHDLFRAAIRDFSPDKRADTSWIDSLRVRWAALLPDVPWPEHSPERIMSTPPLGLGTQQSVYAYTSLFALQGGDFKPTRRWATKSQRKYPQLAIIDNDVRALFYARLAADLQRIVGPEATVRYVGGALRTPMMVTLAERAAFALEPDAALRLETWLANEWSRQRVRQALAVPMPFWFEAVIATADTRKDIAGVILEFRAKASRLRKTRHEIEARLADGDVRAAAELLGVLRADAQQLSSEASRRSKAALDILDAGLKTLMPLPVGPKLAVSALGALIGNERTTGLLLQLFRPELRCVYDLGRHAARLGNALPRAFEKFGLAKGTANEPLRFLQRLGQTSTLS